MTALLKIIKELAGVLAEHWKAVAVILAFAGAAYAGYWVRGIEADRDEAKAQNKVAEALLKERDAALAESERLNKAAEAAARQTAADQIRINELRGRLRDAKPLPAGCVLDADRVRLLAETP